MALVDNMDKIFTWFGKYINPAFVSASIAAAKGIFRPIFTMSDKKQDKKSRVYAALREGLTEGIAIPVYLGSGALAKYISKKVAKPEEMAKDLFESIIDKKNTFDVKKLAGTAFSEADAATVAKNFHKMNGTLSMLGVFASALVIIPALCSLTIKPIMKSINKKNASETKPEAAISNYAVNQRHIYNDKYKTLSSFPVFSGYSSGMKVGSV